jgi:hypothetical protein
VADGAAECAACGIILAKWRPRTEPGVTRVSPSTPLASASTPRGRGSRRFYLAGIAVTAVIAAAAYWNSTRRTAAGHETSASRPSHDVEPVLSSGDFDRAYPLNGSLLGLATDGRQLIAGNRSGGVLRIRFDGERLDAEPVAVLEPVYQQNISLDALTYNGREYVGIAQANWFQKGDGEVFTIHDAKSLALLRTHPAPPSVGCVAFDGQRYWAATRKNTADEKIDHLLYQLDASLNVVRSWPAPGFGCQGLAWDGRYLWHADVFDDTLTVLDPSVEPPRAVNSETTEIGYLSGITWFDAQMWLTEYGDNRLVRLRPALRASLAGGPAAAPVAEPQLAAAVAVPGVATAPVFVSEPKSSDSRKNSLAKREWDDAEVLEHSVELRDDGVYGSWRIWFGPDVFTKREQNSIITVPQFARYTVTVETPSGQRIEKELEGTAGEHVMHDVRLCDAREPGEYSMSIFIHVQFVSADGGARILNRSNLSVRVRK